MEPLKCPHCEEITVEPDQHCGQEQLVCTACGAVYSESVFFSEHSTEDPSTFGRAFADKHRPATSVQLPWTIAKEQYKETSLGVKTGLKRLDNLASAFAMPSYMRLYAIDLFKKTVCEELFVNTRSEKKVALAAVCVYFAMRTSEWPITITSLCELVQVSLPTFNEVLKTVSLITGKCITSTPVEELLSSYLKDYKLDDKKMLSTKTLSIIELGQQLWVLYGKRPDVVLSAATYMAWVSLNIGQRYTVTYKKFCEIAGLRMVSSTPLRYRELCGMVTKLAGRLPWLQGKTIDKKEMLYNLDHVLKFSRALLAKTQSQADDDTTEFLPPAKKHKVESQIAQTTYDLPMLTVSNSPELTEDDIPEDDLIEYIRDPKEVEAISRLMMKQTSL